MKTLGYEEVLGKEYRDLAEALDSRIPGKGLQPETLAPALGDLPPDEFDEHIAANGV